MSHEIVFYCEEGGFCPFLKWFDSLPAKAQDKCLAKIERLKELGHLLRRPEADYLRDEIYELRIGLQGINYRILYFFHGRKAIVLSHGIIKERIVPVSQIDKAVRNKINFEKDPISHSFAE